MGAQSLTVGAAPLAGVGAGRVGRVANPPIDRRSLADYSAEKGLQRADARARVV